MDKKDCFAYVKPKQCYCLVKQECENCNFYKNSRQAKEEYKKYREKTLENGIAYSIDKYFMNL